MNTKHQLWCAWSVLPFFVIYLFGFIGVAGFVPPPSPLMTPAEVVTFYEANRLGIRAGQLIALASSGFLFFWPAAISAQMARIEKGPLPILSLIQYVAATVLTIFFMLCSLVWSIAAFRPDLDPDTLRMLNDAGWLIFVMAYPEYLAQLICIAVVCLMDKRAQPLLPRWACYFTLWVAFVGIGGGFSTFFKSGPFAWNGLIGFWLPVAFFVFWTFAVMLPFLLKAIKRQALEEGRVT